jgi:hypothetical protein
MATKSKSIKICNGKESSAKGHKNILQEIEELKASGMTNTEEFRSKARELEVILGIDTINPFGTNELDIFEDNLKEMNLSDMKKMAERIGLNSYHDRSTLKAMLIKQFKEENRNNRRNIMPNQINSFILDPKNPQHAETLKILGDF